jgi:RHS repeat-associated protein
MALVETRTPGRDGSPEQLTRYQFGNHLGSSSLEVDGKAKIISYEEYYPYGSTSYQAVRSRKETPKRYQYTGKERDEESGLYYYGARHYASWLGRWTACDPAGLVDGGNLYVYVQDNPLGFEDINGLQTMGFGELEVDTVLGKVKVQKGIKTSSGYGHGLPYMKIQSEPVHVVAHLPKGPMEEVEIEMDDYERSRKLKLLKETMEWAKNEIEEMRRIGLDEYLATESKAPKREEDKITAEVIEAFGFAEGILDHDLTMGELRKAVDELSFGRPEWLQDPKFQEKAKKYGKGLDAIELAAKETWAEENDLSPEVVVESGLSPKEVLELHGLMQALPDSRRESIGTEEDLFREAGQIGYWGVIEKMLLKAGMPN